MSSPRFVPTDATDPATGATGGGAAHAFDLLDLEQPPATGMRDPQQPVPSAAAERRALSAREGAATAMVSDADFPQLERSTAFSAARGGARLDPSQETARILAEARETARMMLQQARDAIAVEREAVLAAAKAEGFAEGTREADEEAAGLVRTCELIGVHVMEERERVLAQSEGDVVTLAMSIAERIVGAALHVDPELVVESCRGAMRKAFQRESMQVLAHPDDLDCLRSAGPELARELGGVQHLDFVEERRLERGSVIVRTPAGEIDGTIRGKADKIEQALREGIESRRAERDAA